MPSEDTKKLEFPQNCKSDKATSIINAYFEILIKKIDGCKNNPDKSSTKSMRTYSTQIFNVYKMRSSWY